MTLPMAIKSVSRKALQTLALLLASNCGYSRSGRSRSHVLSPSRNACLLTPVAITASSRTASNGPSSVVSFVAIR